MNELLPYEEQLAGKLADIILPDESRGWDAMREMLEEDDDDSVPPPANTGCRNRGLAGLLLLLGLIAICVAIYKMVNRRDGDNTNKNILSVSSAEKNNRDSIKTIAGTPAKSGTGGVPVNVNNASAGKVSNEKNYRVLHSNNYEGDSKSSFSLSVKKGALVTKAGKNTQIEKGMFAVKTTGNTKPVGYNVYSNKTKGRFETGTADTLNGAFTTGDRTKKPGETGKTTYSDSVRLPFSSPATGAGEKGTAGNDSLKKAAGTIPIITTGADKGKVIKKDIFVKPVDEDDKNNQIWFSSGLGLQQLIPIDGQKANPYNAFGRKGSLADYIPSVYFRAHQNRKFLQVEFKYGAPQYTKDISYRTKIINYDTTTHVTTSSANHVNKTYYHQLPMSIHYEVMPGFSFGAGAVWNRFQSAVVSQQTNSSNGLTGIDSIISTKVISVKSDSAFAKSYWQFMLEAQYSFKRFSLGARYSLGLQPFITYTLPVTGQTQRERNASLNVFIRYELWKPKKK